MNTQKYLRKIRKYHSYFDQYVETGPKLLNGFYFNAHG